MPKIGCLSTSYESEYQSQEVTSRADFWKLAHELTVKHTQAKDQCSQKAQKLSTHKYHSDMEVTSYGNLNKIIRIKGLATHEFSLDSSIGNILNFVS